LERGGTLNGRRFQQSSSFIFTAYAFDARRRIGGVSFAAGRNGGECNQEISVSDVKEVIDFLDEMHRNAIRLYQKLDQKLELE
jgi:hypothetical protein